MHTLQTITDNVINFSLVDEKSIVFFRLSRKCIYETFPHYIAEILFLKWRKHDHILIIIGLTYT